MRLICIAILSSSTFLISGAAAWGGTGDVVKVVKSVRQDYEAALKKAHGIGALSALTARIEQEFSMSNLAPAAPGDPCPALGYSEKDIGSAIEAKVLNRSGAYYMTGVKALLKMHPEAAAWSFASASLEDSGCSVYFSNLGFVLNEEGDYTRALTVLEQARMLDPADSSVYVNIARSYQGLSRYDEAISSIMIAMSLEPGVKEYGRMLERLKKLREKDRKYALTKDASRALDRADMLDSIDSALGLVQEKQAVEAQKQLESAMKQKTPVKGRREDGRRPVRRDTDLVRNYSPSSLSSDDGACGYFMKQAYVLERTGDEMVQGTGYAISGNPIEKFIGAGTSEKEHAKKMLAKSDKSQYSNTHELVSDFAVLGGLETSMLFYGLAGEIYEMCGKTEPWDEWDELISKAKREHEQWKKNFFKEMDKETFSKPVCTYKVCVSRGSQGTIHFNVSDPWLGVEFKVHPTNLYKFELKLSKGGDIFKKTGLNNLISGGASYSHYFEWKYGRGMSMGTEVGAGGQLGNLISTKGSKSVSIVKYSFENATGSVKKP